MPVGFMDWVVVVGVVFAAIGVVVAFLRRPKKTTNVIVNGSGNDQAGGDGTTDNKIEGGDNNKQRG